MEVQQMIDKYAELKESYDLLSEARDNLKYQMDELGKNIEALIESGENIPKTSLGQTVSRRAAHYPKVEDVALFREYAEKQGIWDNISETVVKKDQLGNIFKAARDIAKETKQNIENVLPPGISYYITSYLVVTKPKASSEKVSNPFAELLRNKNTEDSESPFQEDSNG